MGRMLTYRQAAVVARVDISTVKRWRRQGMPMGIDERGRRIVEEGVLFQWKRDKIRANPIRRSHGGRVGLDPPPLHPLRMKVV